MSSRAESLNDDDWLYVHVAGEDLSGVARLEDDAPLGQDHELVFEVLELEMA